MTVLQVIGTGVFIAMCILWSIGLGFTAHRLWLDHRKDFFQWLREELDTVFHKNVDTIR